jgi:hypothetical protein
MTHSTALTSLLLAGVVLTATPSARAESSGPPAGETDSAESQTSEQTETLSVDSADGGSAGDDGSSQRDEDAEEDGEDEDNRIGWYVIPNVAYDSDDGLGFGVRGELALHERGYEPYRAAFVLHAFASLRNYHHHRFRFDRVGLGSARRLRLTVHAAYRQWGNDGYWGIGNGTTREREFVGDFESDDPRRQRYRYTLIQPFVHATLRAEMGGGVALFVSLNGKWSVVSARSISLLEEQQPYGMEGGLTLLFSAGLIYDTRQPEVEPRRGLLAEVSGQWAAPLPWGPGNFGGAFFSLRAYHSLASWLVLAWRVMAEMLGGDVPFYEMVHWRGSAPIAGFGGFETLRGVSFGRWRAPSKALANVELRFRLGEHNLFRRPLTWQLGLFGDAGVVWAAGDDALEEELDFPLHVAGGLGLRLIFDRSFVGRLDVGFSNDPVREPTGEVSSAFQYGIYVVFDQAF